VQRSVHLLPKNGTRAPWRLGMNYAQDVLTLRYGRVADRAMRFSRLPVSGRAPADGVAAVGVGSAA
jgi:hypothetical protein